MMRAGGMVVGGVIAAPVLVGLAIPAAIVALTVYTLKIVFKV